MYEKRLENLFPGQLIDALMFFFFFRLAGTDANGFPLREEFAKSCFETLLQFSFVNGTAEVDQRVEQPGGLLLFGVESSTHTSVVITIQ